MLNRIPLVNKLFQRKKEKGEVPVETVRIGPWAQICDRVSRIVFRVRIGEKVGTAFAISVGSIPNTTGSALMLATAWHVAKEAEKPTCHINLTSADETNTFDNSNDTIDIFRLGTPLDDTAIITVISPNQKITVDQLHPLLSSDYIPVRGGEIGWIGFPYLVWPQLCFFKGVVSGFFERLSKYLADGVAINGISGGPVFNKEGVIFGMVSAYIPNRLDQLTTLPGLVSVGVTLV